MYERAIEVFTQILRQQPDWEHGLCHYEIALCYEELGKSEDAEKAFRRALQYEPENDVYLGGLASFLYVAGKCEEAFKAHLDLLRLKASNRDQAGIETTKTALNALGRKLGMTEAEVTASIGSAVAGSAAGLPRSH